MGIYCKMHFKFKISIKNKKNKKGIYSLAYVVLSSVANRSSDVTNNPSDLEYNRYAYGITINGVKSSPMTRTFKIPATIPTTIPTMIITINQIM